MSRIARRNACFVVSLVSFSSDGATLASGADDGTVRIWDAATGRQLQALRASSLPVFART